MRPWPAPLIIIAAWTLAAGLQELMPLWLPELEITGWVLVLMGMSLISWAAIVMSLAGTTLMPWNKPSELVSSGPFGLTRNPMYVGMVLISLGAALLLGHLWAVGSTLLAALMIDRYTIRREEAILRQSLGEPYMRYRNRVRRWL